MKFILAVLPWLVFAGLIGTGMVLCVNGNPWLLVVSLLAFIFSVGKIGCATH